MKKVVLKLEFSDDKVKQKVMQKVSGLVGIESVAIDNKDKKLTVVGDIDAVKIVSKLRKLCYTDIVSVGPAKEPEKKKDESQKKDDPKKGGDEKKGGGGGGGGDNKKNESKGDAVKAYPAYQQHYLPAYHQNYQPPMPYQYHHYQPTAPAYYARSAEEDPNSCVIC
ncbi:heavy metal-associated isoprenylated plant protein 39-like [Coffea eugenioides]|uniref:HMA domain-containing protein n=1 Tax=Coffea arabica TaxID=13443 RepID=A0A6P6W4A0_COFAR|nr:heavy metal-associated isoprenylated plant protein 39-like [Coffea arabica]XP_027160283.1 heavy metal-associated isoprenylated plant protein 39-like [Coffea eugenioides]